jgi:hypothetical protein
LLRPLTSPSALPLPLFPSLLSLAASSVQLYPWQRYVCEEDLVGSLRATKVRLDSKFLDASGAFRVGATPAARRHLDGYNATTADATKECLAGK